MKQNNQFKQLEKKAYLHYHEDGIVDIIIGLCCLGFAGQMATGNTVFSMFSWMPILFLRPLKNKITFPRIGYVNFDTKRGRSVHIVLLGVVTFVLGLTVLGTFLLWTGDNMNPDVRRWIGEHFILLLGLIFSSVLLAAAIISNIKRLYVYAALGAMLSIISFLMELPDFASMMILGVVILLSGAFHAYRFINKYPIVPED